MTDLAEPATVDRARVADVADGLVRLSRSMNRQRSRMIAAAHHDVEWSAHLALKILQTEGPMRAGALAECLQSDPSTVSRQVASMVRDGLLERRADPIDGRATILVPTAHAREVLVDHDRIRLDFFADVLAGWSEDDLRAFASMLSTFTDAYDESTSSDRMAERFGSALRPGGNC